MINMIRRELLRTGSLGLAAVMLPALRGQDATRSPKALVFDTFGAVGCVE